MPFLEVGCNVPDKGITINQKRGSVKFDSFTLDFQLTAAQKAQFLRDPEGYLAKVLRAEGQVVNGVVFLPKERGNRLRSAARCLRTRPNERPIAIHQHGGALHSKWIVV